MTETKERIDKTKVVISVSGVSKYFSPSKGQRSIKQAFTSFFSSKKDSAVKDGYWALKDVGFEVYKGEFFGIVGRNGSGKSTLLKMIAGVYTPTKGSIDTDGKIVPFIELGVGFNAELTGKDNVFLNGALLGFTRKEMMDMYDDIVSFAELQDHMDIKLKNFSSGMQVRLAFSIAIRAKSDILLVDEVLAVGDSSFQKKCFEIFTALKKEGRTIVFITHDMTAIERFCDRVLVIDKTKARGIYTPNEAGAIYDHLNAKYNTEENDISEVTGKAPSRWGSGEVRLDKVTVFSEGKLSKNNVVEMGEDLEIRMSFTAKTTKKIVIGLAFEDIFGVNIAGPNSIGVNLSSKEAVSYKANNIPLVPGEYKVTIAIYDQDIINEYDHLEKSVKLTVTGKSHNIYGKVNLFGKWSI